MTITILVRRTNWKGSRIEDPTSSNLKRGQRAPRKSNDTKYVSGSIHGAALSVTFQLFPFKRPEREMRINNRKKGEYAIAT